MSFNPMILGVDVSTSKIGIALLDKDKKIVVSEVIKMKPENTLEERAILFENKLLKLKKYYFITDVFIEEPFIAFGGGKTTAQTMAKLQRFNGMCSYIAYKVFEDSHPEMVNVRTARNKLGIKIPKGVKDKDAKKVIIEWVQERFESFKYEETAHGNPLPGTDDRADAVVIALYGYDQLFSV
jgi:RNase H-fold protein (predicted Holliday junction resolvase)